MMIILSLFGKNIIIFLYIISFLLKKQRVNNDKIESDLRHKLNLKFIAIFTQKWTFLQFEGGGYVVIS